MKKFWQLAAATVLALGLAACGNEKEETTPTPAPAQQEETETAFPVTVTDALGNDITLEQAPEKIVSLTPSNTEILFELGLEDEIVGVNDNDNYPEEVADKTRIGGMEYNLEVIVSLQPDIVFAHESSLFSEGVFTQLKEAGLTVFIVNNATTFEEVYETIEDIGELTGRDEEADVIVENIQQELTAVKEKLADVEPRTAFMVVGATPDIYAVGKNTFMDEMLKAINVENIVQQEGWPMYSAEDFVSANPDSIIVTYEEDVNTIKNNEAFSAMTAIQNGAIGVVDGDTTSRQGPRLAEGVESMAKAIYPEAFK